MATLTLVNPFSLPLHVASWQRPKGNVEYRVTNGFDGPDFLNGGKHRATDVGNTRTGDTLRCPALNASAMGKRHTDGALGVIFDLGNGLTLQLWHLNRVAIPLDRWTPVARGQAVGVTGNSGARLPDGSPMPAHTHISAERQGIPFDIEPHLPMVERPAQPIPTGEDDVKIKGRFLRHVQNRRAVLTTDSHFRSGVDAGDDDSLGVLAAGTVLYPIVAVGGREAGTAADKAEWYGALAYVASAYQLGYVHSSVLPRTADGKGVLLDVIEAADCSAQEQSIAQLSTRISRARTSATGAAQAATATVEALR